MSSNLTKFKVTLHSFSENKCNIQGILLGHIVELPNIAGAKTKFVIYDLLLLTLRHFSMISAFKNDFHLTRLLIMVQNCDRFCRCSWDLKVLARRESQNNPHIVSFLGDAFEIEAMTTLLFVEAHERKLALNLKHLVGFLEVVEPSSVVIRLPELSFLLIERKCFCGCSLNTELSLYLFLELDDTLRANRSRNISLH